MIIDSHAYCFEPADSPRGYESADEHLRWVQAGYAGHHQPAFRLRDRAPSPSRVLAPEDSNDLSLLPDATAAVQNSFTGHTQASWGEPAPALQPGLTYFSRLYLRNSRLLI